MPLRFSSHKNFIFSIHPYISLVTFLYSFVYWLYRARLPDISYTFMCYRANRLFFLSGNNLFQHGFT